MMEEKEYDAYEDCSRLTDTPIYRIFSCYNRSENGSVVRSYGIQNVAIMELRGDISRGKS